MESQEHVQPASLATDRRWERIGVLSTIREAMALVWRFRAALLVRLFIPVFLFLLIWTLASRMPAETPGTIRLLFVGLEFMLFTLFSVTSLRIFLLGPDAVPRFGLIRWGRRESSFLLVVVGLYLIDTLAAVLLTTLAGAVAAGFILLDVNALRWLFYLSLIPSTYLLVRLFLLLPAQATGSRLKPAEVWHLTRFNGWRLAVVLVGFPWLLVVVRDQFLPPDGPLAAFVAYGLAGVLLMAFEYAALAVCYRRLIGDQPGTRDEGRGSRNTGRSG